MKALSTCYYSLLKGMSWIFTIFKLLESSMIFLITASGEQQHPRKEGHEPRQSGGPRRFRRATAPHQKAAPCFSPIFFRIMASGQKPVKEDCSRFAPTKAVSQNQLGFTRKPSARLTRITVPANASTARSMLIACLLLILLCLLEV